MSEQSALKRFKSYLENHPATFFVLLFASLGGFFSTTIKSMAFLYSMIATSPDYESATPENPIRLRGAEIVEILVDATEIGMVLEPSEEFYEGRSRTWYTATYAQDGSMTYDHADHDFRQKIGSGKYAKEIYAGDPVLA